jgi:hypothetical protein
MQGVEVKELYHFQDLTIWLGPWPETVVGLTGPGMNIWPLLFFPQTVVHDNFLYILKYVYFADDDILLSTG